ncbi:uncharacterized protein LOC131251995 [Magnolia sinica]|uniref:uncharacterized protein LOC131251995 n=1 Tax=Magnolia sinica TaxID=86752 RepID=UPI002658D0D2|nr:uncharacterized protein LOC131251995 [Magnolia sinica]
MEEESVHPATFKDDGFLRQIITSYNVKNKSHSAELPNSWDCLAHFAGSNDPMSKDKVDPLQDNILVVITDRENPYSEAPSSLDLKRLPLKEEEPTMEPKSDTSECVEITSLLKKFSKLYLRVVSDSPWSTNVETSSVTGESYIRWIPQAIQWKISYEVHKSLWKVMLQGAQAYCKKGFWMILLRNLLRDLSRYWPEEEPCSMIEYSMFVGNIAANPHETTTRPLGAT